MEVGFVRPVKVEILVNRRAVANSVERVLIGAGTDLKAEVEEAFWVVFGVPAFFSRRQGQEGSGESVGIVLHMDLVVIAGVSFEADQVGDSGIIPIDLGFCGET